MSLYMVPIQTRTGDPTPYEHQLAVAIEGVFGEGEHSLEGLVEGLNAAGVFAPDGQVWTADSFTTEIARLGNR
ncbi:recombinase-like helix-turn-helix domain-containing protein [Gordonia hydrophobica]|uniref:Recombinase-like helix-turn-helix domain-containing protein n=1 Tax=Gordonia hydrophobica TaxID=40516 RepID=A0ABZ2U5L9_9ACTN|nr:recombinase-like helix-turn-helix domain-containing protein [Gordonia hydrophobica]MBM7365692.1 hypothetical protein [Gordonia hydrophobica]